MEKPNTGLLFVRMKALPLIILLLGCEPKGTYQPQTWWEDTVWIDESPIDTEVIEHIYNAKKIEDIFPSDTLDEGLSYDEYFIK